MANKQLVIALSSLCLAVPGLAVAEKFSGFTAKGKYMQGGKLCAPVRGDFDAPKCSVPSSKPAFAKGIEQVGDKKLVEVRKKGTKLEIIAIDDGRRLFLWDSGEVLTGVGQVHIHTSGCFVAVDYSWRLGGKTITKTVVLDLKKAIKMDSTPPTLVDGPGQPNPVGPATPTGPTLAPDPVTAELPADFIKAMKTGVKWAARRKHTKAIPAFRNALKIVPNQPEALYRLARSQYASKDATAANKTLSKLASQKGQEGAKWRVEARFDKVFKPLRSDPGFRKAVGIDRPPGEKISSYERLVSLGGKWEQDAMNCEQPRVNLTLLRNKKRRFDLVIRSECQGNRETTRLDGSWLASSPNKLQLRFPNTGANDEGLVCTIEVCSDASGEDCLRCKPEPDMEFLLRVVRR